MGRAAQVEELLAGLAPDGGGRAVVVSAGMGGVGTAVPPAAASAVIASLSTPIATFPTNRAVLPAR